MRGFRFFLFFRFREFEELLGGDQLFAFKRHHGIAPRIRGDPGEEGLFRGRPDFENRGHGTRGREAPVHDIGPGSDPSPLQVVLQKLSFPERGGFRARDEDRSGQIGRAHV